MNQRQQDILREIVSFYAETALPVGSNELRERGKFEVSTATLRNDMAELEEAGYLFQPHVSAGRVPTDKAYRFYVEQLMNEERLTKSEEAQLRKELLVMKTKQARLARTTAKLLSALSGNLAVSGLAGRDEFYDFGMRELIEKPEFREMDELARLAEALDTLDERCDQIMKTLKDDETRIYIGSENPLASLSNSAMIISPYRTQEGERGILAIIGPKRMEYGHNKSLLEYARLLLSGGVPVILILVGTTV